MSTPPQLAIDHAVAEANRSPCAKSKRGVVIMTSAGRVVASGHNAQPYPFKCDGSAECRAACGQLCEHAEAAAIREFRHTGRGYELLHVKTVDGELVTSGGPSCWQCSRAILADERIAGVWLYHDTGWRRYTPVEFHELTLRDQGLPVLRGDR